VGYPYLTLTAILAMIAIVSAMAFIPSLRSSLLFGALSAAAMWGLRLRNFLRSAGTSASRSRSIPVDRGAVHGAPFRQIVRNRIMLRHRLSQKAMSSTLQRQRTVNSG